MPAGVELDLGATAKAVAADRCAALVHGALGVGVLVSLGGDIATAGTGPGQRLADPRPGPRRGPVDPDHAARRRRGRDLQHRLAAVASRRRDDAPHRRPAHRPPGRARCGAASPWPPTPALRANAVTTAALVRGERAVDWVRGLGLPARFLRADGALVAHRRLAGEVAA